MAKIYQKQLQIFDTIEFNNDIFAGFSTQNSEECGTEWNVKGYRKSFLN